MGRKANTPAARSKQKSITTLYMLIDIKILFFLKHKLKRLFTILSIFIPVQINRYLHIIAIVSVAFPPVLLLLAVLLSTGITATANTTIDNQLILVNFRLFVMGDVKDIITQQF